MVASVLMRRELELDEPSQTERLANWISRVRSKKLQCRHRERRDLRVEAVLTDVLAKAESELRGKQVSRIAKWRQMRQRLGQNGCRQDVTNNNNGNSGYYCYYGGVVQYQQQQQQVEYDVWRDPESLCPELVSLDSFMAQLKEVKVPVER